MTTTNASTHPDAEDHIERLTQRVVTFFALISIALMLKSVADAYPVASQLHFNPYAILSLISLITNVVALALLSRVKQRTDTMLWFSLHLLSLAVWAFTEMMFRLSATPEAANFWAPTTTIGAVFMPISLYMFALSYTNSRRSLQPIIFLSLMGGTILYLFTDARTSILTHYAATSTTLSPWGYTFTSGPLYYALTLWLVVLATAALILIWRFRRRTIDPTLRRQAKLFMIAISIPLVGGGITDGLLPDLNLVLVPPLTVILLALMGLIISYGILRFRFFSFTPGLIAGQILATMNEAVIGLDTDLRISYANAGAEKLLGLPAAKFAHKRLGSFFSQQWTTAQLRDNLLGPLAASDFYTLDSVDLRTADGTNLTTKLSITKVHDDGQLSGYLVVLTDITAIAQATAIIESRVAEQTQTIRQTKAKLVNSINSLDLGFLITDARPEAILVNEAAHTLFCGIKSHTAATCTSITVASIQDKFGPEAPFLQAIRDCLGKQHSQGIKTATLNHRIYHIFVSPMIDRRKATGTAIVIQDITEEQILNRSRDEFFSIASHELRTPLTAIKGNSSMVLQYYAEALKDPALHEMITDIHGSSERLIGIVNDFLDVSRLEQGKVSYKLEAVTVADIAEKIVYELGSVAAQKHTELKLGTGLHRTDATPQVIADAARLKQILYNLFGNALKFTDHGRITLAATAGRSLLNVTITDTGIGIAPEQQQLLFHKFQQAGDSLLTRDGSKGTGLGLYIARHLAADMGGSLELTHSEPGKGTTFTLTLPLATPTRLKKLAATAPTTTTDITTGLSVPTAKN